MQKLILFSFLFLVFGCYGKSIENLNKANGFKDFKIGDPISKWSRSVKLKEKDNYLYNGNSEQYKTAFGNGVDLIQLLTDENGKIDCIFVFISGKWNSYGIGNIRESIEAAFGKRMATNEQNGYTFYVWSGNIALSLIVETPDEKGRAGAMLMYASKKYITKGWVENTKKDY